MKLDRSVSAVITGGASGLGETMARALAATGVRVAIFDLNEEKGAALAATLEGVFCKVDIGADASVDAGLEKARRALGQERILINCAGIGEGFITASKDKATGRPKHFPLDSFTRTVSINLIGTFRCIAKSAAGMLTLDGLEDGERGVIVNTASVAATDGQIGQAAYSASKAGIVGMTLPIARDLAREGIRINTIMPGIFDTPPMRKNTDEMRSALMASVPFPKRLGYPEEFASMALEILRNRYLNGEAIRLDGAIRMAPR